MSLTEGQAAPALDLPTDGGGQISLSALKGQPVVVFFYPKASTPGCTNEARDFTALADDFAAAGATVIGVSRDSVKKLDNFKAKQELKVILASDEAGTVTEAWGVWIQKKLYGREYMGIERATFLISADGTISRIWHNVKVSGHAAEVLAQLKSL